jgi:hypothetical protein
LWSNSRCRPWVQTPVPQNKINNDLQIAYHHNCVHISCLKPCLKYYSSTIKVQQKLFWNFTIISKCILSQKWYFEKQED